MKRMKSKTFTPEQIEKIKKAGYKLRAEKGWSLEMIGQKYGRTRSWASSIGLGKVKRFSAVMK